MTGLPNLIGAFQKEGAGVERDILQISLSGIHEDLTEDEATDEAATKAQTQTQTPTVA